MSRFGTLLRIEVIKARKRPALWITLGVFTFITLVVVLAGMIQGGGTGPAYAMPLIWRGVLQPPINTGPFFLAAAMILLFAPEFSWKTARQNVIDGLAKEHVFFSKLITFGILVAVFFMVPLVIGVAVSIASPEPNGTFARATEFNHMLGLGLALSLWGTIGLMIAATVRASGAALGIMFLYFLVENMLTSVVSFWNPATESYLGFLPSQLFDTLTRIEFYYPDELARTNARREAMGQPLLEFTDFPVVVTALLAYMALFLGVAFTAMRKRDL